MLVTIASTVVLFLNGIRTFVFTVYYVDYFDIMQSFALLMIQPRFLDEFERKWMSLEKKSVVYDYTVFQNTHAQEFGVANFSRVSP